MGKKVKVKVLGLVCVFLFVFSVFIPVIESSFPFDNSNLKTSDTYADFYAISESDNPTRWILQGADIEPVEGFHDDINTDYWDLCGVSVNSIRTKDMPTDDSIVVDTSPDNNYGNAGSTYVTNAYSGNNQHFYMKYQYPYLSLV